MTASSSIERRSALLLLALAGATLDAAESIRCCLGPPESLLEATSAAMERAGLGKELVTRIVAIRSREEHLRHEEMLQQKGCTSLAACESGFPERLLAIPRAPAAIFVRGRLPDATRPAVAVIGSRSCTPEGETLAFDVADELSASGVAVVSGLARGIDSAALRGSLARTSCSVGVLGSGLDHVYPPENGALFEKVAGAGALVSEFPLGTAPRKYLFPRRNRIISGLADAVLVVEASDRSGTLITVDNALEQDRTVMAVPGPVGPEYCKGTNRLIRDGAQVILSHEDIFASLAISPSRKPREETDRFSLSSEEKMVLHHCSRQAATPDLLAMKTGLAINDLLGIVSRLERQGLLRRFAGPRFMTRRQRRGEEAHGGRGALRGS